MPAEDGYLESQVMTASPQQLHLMVIDGAIRQAGRAEQALRQGDIEAAHFALNDSRGFVGELISGLDEQHAPQLIETLKGLFFFVFRCLVEADLHRDPLKVRDALQILNSHRETWVTMMRSANEENASETKDADRRIEPDSQSPTPKPHRPQPRTGAEQTGRSWTS